MSSSTDPSSPSTPTAPETPAPFQWRPNPVVKQKGMQALSRREEEALIKEAKTQARKICVKEVEGYVDCVRGRTFSVMWYCQDYLKVMNACLAPLCSDAVLDQKRMDFLSAKARKARNEAVPEKRDGSRSPYSAK